VRWALDQPPTRSILIDGNGRAAPVSVLEPRAYCMLRFMSLDVEEMSVIRHESSTELNSAMVKLVQERWTEPFEADHVGSIGPLREAPEEDGFPPNPRI
jgi:hypothetical protein